MSLLVAMMRIMLVKRTIMMMMIMRMMVIMMKMLPVTILHCAGCCRTAETPVLSTSTVSIPWAGDRHSQLALTAMSDCNTVL